MLARIALLACLGLLALTPSSALASSTPNWGQGIDAPLPAGHATNPSVTLDNVACPAAGECTAVGGYRDSSNASQGWLLNESAGTWSAAEAPLPTGANTDPGVGFGFRSLSCASVGNCTAVGSYDDGSSYQQGLLLTESSGTWSSAEANLPAAPSHDPNVILSSVSCASPGNCSAVGSYIDNSGNTQGLLLTETAGVWGTGVEAALPNPNVDPSVTLDSVSCASAGNCSAVGYYSDDSGNRQGLLLTESSGTWSTGVEATLPVTPTVDPEVGLHEVSCSSAGNCTAVGDYVDNSNHTQGVLLTESSGVWSTGVAAALPTGAATNPSVDLEAVSCSSAGNCTAAGGYADTPGDSQGLLLTQSSGVWATGVKAPLPADANASPQVGLFNVSCVGTFCAAVGDYSDTSSHGQVVLLSESGGTWSAVRGAMPSNAATDPGGDLDGLSCVSPGNCVASGEYTDSAPASQGILFSAAPASPKLSVSAPAVVAPGTTIAASSIKATLSGGSSPTGTITFKVFGPQASPPSSCTSGGTTVGTATISGNGSYSASGAFKPTSAGDYWWYASYDGDLSDNPAASSCGTSMAKTIADAGPPSIKLTSPGNNTTYAQGQAVKAGYSCTDPDGATDVVRCAGPVTRGKRINTSKPGNFSFTVTATDRAGEQTTKTVHYAVVGLTTSGKVKTKARGARIVVDPGIRLSCPAHGSRCTAVLSAKVIGAAAHKLRRSALVIGRARFGVAAGHRSELTFTLTGAGAQLLRVVGRLTVKVTVVARVDHYKAVKRTKAITINPPARRH